MNVSKLSMNTCTVDRTDVTLRLHVPVDPTEFRKDLAMFDIVCKCVRCHEAAFRTSGEDGGNNRWTQKLRAVFESGTSN